MEAWAVNKESDPDSLADLERPEFVIFEYMSEHHDEHAHPGELERASLTLLQQQNSQLLMNRL